MMTVPCKRVVQLLRKHTGSLAQPSRWKHSERRRKSCILPTLDASPLLDPSLYLKKSIPPPPRLRELRETSVLHEPNNTGVLLLAQGQSLIRDWIQQGGTEFALVGHGVPMQLLQSCVDTAWEILNCNDYILQKDGEPVVDECYFQSTTLEFDCMNIRTKDGTFQSIAWPFPSSAKDVTVMQQQIQIYLTVMTRISCAFVNLSIEDSDMVKPNYWKTELLKGFVYPPSATIFSTAFWNDGEDCSSGQRISDLTSPPIVELTTGDNGCTIVRITLQGIQSEGSSDIVDDDDATVEDTTTTTTTSGRGMVPVSLIFEASY